MRVITRITLHGAIDTMRRCRAKRSRSTRELRGV